MKQYDVFQKKSLLCEKKLTSYIEVWKKVKKLSFMGSLFYEAKPIELKEIEK